jgi:hypothetical protein
MHRLSLLLEKQKHYRYIIWKSKRRSSSGEAKELHHPSAAVTLYGHGISSPPPLRHWSIGFIIIDPIIFLIAFAVVDTKQNQWQ